MEHILLQKKPGRKNREMIRMRKRSCCMNEKAYNSFFNQKLSLYSNQKNDILIGYGYE